MRLIHKIWIYTLILLPVIAVACYSLFQTRNELIENVKKERHNLALLSAHMLQEKLDHIKDVGLSLSTRPVFRQMVEKKRWDSALALMRDIPSNFSYISAVQLSDKNGVRLDSPLIKISATVRKTINSWQNGPDNYLQPFLSPVERYSYKIISNLILPVFSENGAVSGELILQVDIPKLLEWSSNIRIDSSAFLCIVDHTGHLAVGIDYKKLDTIINYSRVPATQKALAGLSGVEILYNPISKQDELSAYEGVPGYGWGVIVRQKAIGALAIGKNLLPVLLFYCLMILFSALFAGLIIREVARRKKSEQELKAYVDLLEDTYVLIRNAKDEIISWSRGMERLYGWTRKEAIGKVSHELFGTRFPEALEAIKKRLLAEGSWDGELRHSSRSGSPIYVFSHWHLQRDHAGNPLYVIETNNDITELRLAREETRKSEESYRLLIENVKDYAIFLLDKEGCVLTWNVGAEHIKGYKEQEILGKSMEIFYRKEDAALGEPWRNLQMARQYGHFEKEGWRVRKDGSLFWANIIFTALRDPDGKLYGYSKITRDMTERKRAEEQQAFLLRQVNLANDAIYTLDTAYRILSWNQGAQRMYGFSSEEAVGLDSNELLQTIIGEEEKQSLITTINEKGHWSGEITRKTKSGDLIYISNSVSTILDEQGKISGYVVVNLDITKQKKLREQISHLALMVEHSSEAIITRDLKGLIISWNRGAETLFGYSKAEAIGKNVRELAYMRLNSTQIAGVEEQIASAGTWLAEMNYYHRDGSSFFGTVTGNGLRNERGEISAFIFIIRDISTRKQLEEELKVLNEQLEEKVEEKTRAVIERERQLELYIKHSPAAIAMFDRQMRYLVASYRWIADYRLEGVDIMGKSHYEIFPEIGEEWKAIHRRCLAGAVEKREDDQFVRADGTATWLRWEVHPWTDAKGDIGGIMIFTEDITERKQAEQAVAKSEQKYRMFVERITDAFIAIDKDWRYTYLNKQAGEMIRMDPVSLIGKNVWDVFPEAVGSSTWEAFHRAMKEQVMVTNIDYYPPLDLWQENHIYPSEDGLSAFIRDISEKKRAEEEVRKSNERFELVVSATNDIIWDWDIRSNAFWWNNNFYSHFGYAPGAVPADVTSWQQAVHPGDRERVIGGIRSTLEAGKAFWTDEYRFLKADNTAAHILDCGYILYDRGGKPYRMVGAMLDITGRKLAEEQLRTSFEEKQVLAGRLSVILNTLPATVALLNAEGVIVDVNESWKRFADANGYRGDGNYFIGDNYMIVSLHATGADAQDGRAVAEGVSELLKGRREIFEYEYACNSPSEKRWFRMVVSPLREKQYAGAVVMHADISELRRLEEERMQARIEEQKNLTRAILEAQEKERNVIGVELHDNVNQILAGTKLLLSIGQNYPEQSAELIPSAIQNIEQAIEENRKIAHELVVPDFSEIHLLSQLQQLVADMLGKSGMHAVINAAGFDEPRLDDEQKLAIYRIAQEQCTNILKYARAEKVGLFLETAGGFFSMRIVDDGVGQDSKKKASGIGLRNMKSRIQLFNGEIKIRTSAGKGFSLEVSIPLKAG